MKGVYVYRDEIGLDFFGRRCQGLSGLPVSPANGDIFAELYSSHFMFCITHDLCPPDHNTLIESTTPILSPVGFPCTVTAH